MVLHKFCINVLAKKYILFVNKKINLASLLFARLYLIGVIGFEPTASCSQSRRSSQAELHPENFHDSSVQICLRRVKLDVQPAILPAD
jgi:hypothetical protein